MGIYYGDNGTNYVLTDKIGGGGAGTIYKIQGDQAHVAKIFWFFCKCWGRRKQRSFGKNQMRTAF